MSASNAELGGRPAVDVYDAQTLAELAKLYAAVVVQVERPDGELFLLTIDNTTYRYVELRSLGPDNPDAFIGPTSGDHRRTDRWPQLTLTRRARRH